MPTTIDLSGSDFDTLLAVYTGTNLNSLRLIAANDNAEADAPPSPFGPLGLTGGLDYATAYYFRGYLQANSGRILQPYANLFATCPLGDDSLRRRC